MGYILMNSQLYLDGKCIAAAADKKCMEQFKVQARDLDGIINQMRLTQGVEAAVFLYALDENRYKVSLRSNGKVDVSAIAMTFGGGGHYMAAGCTMEGKPEGCTMQGSVYDVINNLTRPIEKQLKERNIKS